MRTARIAAVTVFATLLAGTAPAATTMAAPGENPVVRWNEIALNTITADSTRATPSASSLYVAMVHAAVYDSVMAIEGTHQSYAFDGDAPGASVDAAVATAAHDVLVEYFTAPAQVDTLNAAYGQALDEVEDGASKQDGIATGAAAADAIIALRSHDGRDAQVSAPDAFDRFGAGQWRRTTVPGSPVTPYVANVTPFLADSPEQFRPRGPHSLTSHQYAVEYERTRLYGGKADTPRTTLLRTAEQTEVATFWTENTVRQYNRALRDLAVERALSVADTARMFAMTVIPAADAMITCWNTKYHYLAWRPVTAIALGDEDGNPLTAGDPDWRPFSTTANHPEYTSGHACLTGAITRGLQEFLGTKKIDMTITFVNGQGVEQYSHDFATIDSLRTEIEDARVFGGDHWTTGGTDGTALGDDLAKWALKRFFEEI